MISKINKTTKSNFRRDKIMISKKAYLQIRRLISRTFLGFMLLISLGYAASDGKIVGKVIDKFFYFVHLCAVLIKYFIEFVEEFFFLLLVDDGFNVFELDGFILNFMQVFGCKIIFFHFRGNLPEINLQFLFLLFC